MSPIRVRFWSRALLGAGLLWGGVTLPVRGDGAVAQQEAAVKQIQQNLKELVARQTELQTELGAAQGALKAAKAKAPPAPEELQFAIPRLAKPPVIDGVVNDDEWAGAVGIPLTTGIYGMMERSSSYFFVAWDDEKLYFGQRLPMREGEVPLRLNREPKHDNVYCGETSLEVYVDRKGNGSIGLPCRYQFMGNAVGNQWDREDQYTIGQDYYGWDGDWQYAQRLTPDGKFWEAEIAIPRKTVYQAEPLKPGDLWWIGLATNLHRPWCFSGFYGWKVAAVFADAVPEIRLFHPERSVQKRGIGFDLAIRNTTGAKFEAELVTRLMDKKVVLVEQVRPVTVEPGKNWNISVDDPAGDKAKDGVGYTLSILVRQGDRSLYTWNYPIKYNDPVNKEGLNYTPDPAPFQLKGFYNPLSNYVRVVVDVYDFVQRDAVKSAAFTVRAAGGGKTLGEGKLTEFVYGKGQKEVPVPADLAPGTYECQTQLLDAAGKALATHVVTFVRKDHAKEFPWLNNKIGEDDVLPKPFAPLKPAANGVVEGYKKTIALNGAALPAAVQAAGVDLLAGPVALRGTAAGQPFTLAPTADTPKAGTLSPTQANFSGQAAGGPLSASVTWHLEYDGTAKVTLALAPAAGASSAALDSLQLVIPFKNDAVTHMMANALNMRLTNVAQYLPGKGKTGTVWDSTKVPYQKMTVGSFVPIVWLGNLNSGMTWFADSDQGWWPSAKKPAIEIVRTPQAVELVLNLASEPVNVDAPRTIEFGLNVNPVRAVNESRHSANVFGFLKETGRWDPKVTPSQAFARRYPDNIELNKKYTEAVHGFGEIFSPYTEMSWEDFWKAEADYFREEWYDEEEGGSVLKCESSNDCLLHWTERWIQDAGLDGYYFDNVFCRLNYNLHAGTAYRLPDGRVQPGYDLWGMRSQLKRIRTVFEKYRDPVRIVIHNTEFQFAPIVGFADLVMGGERPTPVGGGRDFMEMYPRDHMDVMYNVPLWGYRLSNLYHFDPKTFVTAAGEYDEAAAFKAHRTAMAAHLVHGVEFFQGINYQPFLMSKYKLLKKMPGDFEFIPSWQAAGRFRVEGKDPDVDVAVWKKDDVLLVVAANYAKKAATARVWVDFPQLIRLPGKLESRAIMDFETDALPQGLLEQAASKEFPRLGGQDGGHNTLKMANTLRFKIEPRDFRAFLIVNLPPGQGAGF